MLDLGLSKMAVIGLVALVVLGPDKLPELARQVGRWVSKTRAYIDQMKRQVEQAAWAKDWKEFENTLPLQPVASAPSVVQGGDVNPNPKLQVVYARRLAWRGQRARVPVWFRTHYRIRRRVQSGAARVQRFRPLNLKRRGHSFQ
jgi:sec-independent protein translocase protein TatB